MYTCFNVNNSWSGQSTSWKICNCFNVYRVKSCKKDGGGWKYQ